MSDLLSISPRYYLASDGLLHCKGRPTLPVVVVPDSNTVRLTRAKALSNGSGVVVGPPTPPVVNRNDAAGALTVGTATYPIPTTGTVRYVDPDQGLDSALGTVDQPWKTIAYAASHVGTGATIVLRAGMYHEGAIPGQAPGGTANGVYFQTTGITVQNYPGEEVWFEGSRIQTGWSANTTAVPGRTVWTKNNWGQFGAGAGIPAFDRSPTAVRGAGDSNTSEGGSWIYIDPAFPIAMWGEQVFVNGAPLRQVATLAEVTTGTFFLDGALKGGTGADKNLFAGSTCYIGTDPTGKEVRASDLSVAFIINASAGVAANITVRGIGVRRYMPALYDNAVVKMQAQGSTLENVHIQHISSSGVTASLRPNHTLRRVTIERCGFRGLHSHQSDNLMVDSVRITGADHRRFNPAPECGGVKVTGCNGLTIKDSVVSNNFCHGLWTDASCGNIKFYSNDIQGNVNGHGIMVELSDTVVTANNLITDNGKIGLYTQSTNNCRHWNNTVVQSSAAGSRAVDLFDDERDYATLSYGQDRRASAFSPMTWVVTNYQQFNNVVGVQGSGSVTYLFSTRSTAADGYRSTAQMGVQSNGNLFVKSGSSPANPFSLARAGGGTDYNSLTSYRAAYPSLEVNSAFQQGGTSPLDSDFSLTSAATTQYSALPRPLPSDIAAMIGQAAGSTHLGAWL